MNDSIVIDSRPLLPGQHHPAVLSLHETALPAGVCVCPGACRMQLGLFVYKREDSDLCLPAAVKTVLENQSEVSTLQLTEAVGEGWGGIPE